MKLTSRIISLLKKSPKYIAARLYLEIRHELDRFSQPRFGRTFSTDKLLKRTGDSSLSDCWNRLFLGQRPFYFPIRGSKGLALDINVEELLKYANLAVEHKVDLMGSGLVSLGSDINWLKDYKSGHTWPLSYFRSIDYVNRDRSSDVKTVWELSRLQWLIPCGQAYVLTGDERYAEAVKEILESWIAGNPYAMSVNWGVTMEPAMRIFVFIWLFYALGDSEAWSDNQFQSLFLRSLYTHAVFTERFIERSDINGNHFTADAAALVAAGAFFGRGAEPLRWLESGLGDLEREIICQVSADGVDFEGSVAYHRLVAELFFVAAVFARTAGYRMSETYLERLRLMGHFTAAYSRPDGTSPLLGDADDARTLPFKVVPVIDHRYLPGLIGLFVGDEELVASISAPLDEVWWWFGPDYASKIPARMGGHELEPHSKAFNSSGYFVLRDRRVNAFIDCAEVGLAGRGGHGHNDVLSFELVLDGVLLVSDAGSFVYTGDFETRNWFRSGKVHSTPMIGEAEQNRFFGEEFLWTLQYDAQPDVRSFLFNGREETIEASHSGYERLSPKITPIRKFTLLRNTGKFLVEDKFECPIAAHDLRIPVQLGPNVVVHEVFANRVTLEHGEKRFYIAWESEEEWELQISRSWISQSYGRRIEATRLDWLIRKSTAQLVMEFGASEDG